MKLAIDLDGCCADWQRAWAIAYELWFDEVITGELNTWDACLRHTHFETYDEFFVWLGTVKNFWGSLRPIPGAQHAVRALCAEHDVTFITHRPVNLQVFGSTSQWLWDNFLVDVPDEDGDWCFTDLAWGTVDPNALRAHLFVTDKPKSSFECDLYIDDSPTVLDDLRQHNLPAIRFNQPWNLACYGATAKSWREVLNLVEALSE